MNAEFDDLKSLWDKGRETKVPNGNTIEQIIAKANEKKKNSLYAHYGNIGVLTLIMLMVGFFFYYLYPFHAPLGRAGVHIMVGGLLLRIIIEIFSVVKFHKIDLTDHTLKATDDSFKFYTFRKRIHGPVTITIVALYILGFFMLTPEYLRFMGTELVLILDVLAISSAVVLVRIIRKDIRKEMADLWEVIELRKRILFDEE